MSDRRRSEFYALSRRAPAQAARVALRHGAPASSFARRFIAGETVEEAIEAARTLQSKGLHLTLDYLGESVRTLEEADGRRRASTCT